MKSKLIRYSIICISLSLFRSYSSHCASCEYLYRSDCLIFFIYCPCCGWACCFYHGFVVVFIFYQNTQTPLQLTYILGHFYQWQFRLNSLKLRQKWYSGREYILEINWQSKVHRNVIVLWQYLLFAKETTKKQQTSKIKNLFAT